MLEHNDFHIKEYLKYKKRLQLLPFSILRIKLELGLLIRYLRERNIASITVIDQKVLRGYLSYSRKTKYWLTKRIRSFATISYKRSLLWNYFEYLYQMGYCPSNPVRQVPIPLEPKRLPEFLSLRQAIRVLKYIGKNKKDLHQFQIRNRAYISLILFYGLQNHEIFKIRLKDINFIKQTIRIRNSPFHDARVLPLFPPLDKWLMEYKRIRPVRKSGIFFQNVKRKSNYGFMTTRGALNNLSKKLKIRISSKILRNTFFSLMFNERIEQRVIQAIVGSHTIKTIKKKSVIEKSNKRIAVEALAM